MCWAKHMPNITYTCHIYLLTDATQARSDACPPHWMKAFVYPVWLWLNSFVCGGHYMYYIQTVIRFNSCTWEIVSYYVSIWCCKFPQMWRIHFLFQAGDEQWCNHGNCGNSRTRAEGDMVGMCPEWPEWDASEQHLVWRHPQQCRQ